MAYITEDYVSFQTAELLKEKGMDKSCFKHYVQKNNNDGTSEAVTVCTLQIAMKWLRKVHNISVEPFVDFGSGNEYWWTADVGYIKKDGLIDELCEYNSYEQAAEAAIRYCLQNLI